MADASVSALLQVVSRIEKSLDEDRADRAALTKSILTLATAVDQNVAAVGTLSAHLQGKPAMMQNFLSGAPETGMMTQPEPIPTMASMSTQGLRAAADAQAPPGTLPGAIDTSGEPEKKTESEPATALAPLSKPIGGDGPAYVERKVMTDVGEVSRWLPTVQTAAKVFRVCNVDTGNMTFDVDFILHLDWYDPNLEHYKEPLADLDFETQYFNPEVVIENAVDSPEFLPGADEIPRWYPDKHHPERFLRKTARYRGSLFMEKADLHCFPFDVQMLPIQLGATPLRKLHQVVKSSDGSKKVHKDAFKFTLEGSWTLQSDKDYLKAQYKSMGNFLMGGASKLLMEFRMCGVSAHPPEQGGKGFQVNIYVMRPIMGSYTFLIIILVFMGAVAALSFWAELVVSGRLSITLTVILTVAVTARPDCISKVPYVTFFDNCFFLTLGISVFISFANIYTVTLCGGFDEESPQFMQNAFARNLEQCDVGWCLTTVYDCNYFIATLVIWFIIMTIMCVLLYRRRERLARQMRKETGQPEPEQGHLKKSITGLVTAEIPDIKAVKDHIPLK